jgi:hypothetical protein
MLKWILIGLVVAVLVSVLAVTIYVEREAPYRSEVLARGASGKALILYHPSRDAQFSEELTEAMARGFEDAKMTVERRTMTAETPARPEGFDVIAVVSNTFYAQPDWPTDRYLKRADLKGIPTLGIMAGAGSTERAEATLTKALTRTGADLRGVYSLWISRPNDPARQEEDNRKVAASMARQFAFELGRQAAAQPKPDTGAD